MNLQKMVLIILLQGPGREVRVTQGVVVGILMGGNLVVLEVMPIMIRGETLERALVCQKRCLQ
jgi:hypothetical protein